MADKVRTLEGLSAAMEDMKFDMSRQFNATHDGKFIWKIPDFKNRDNDAITGKYTSIFSLPFYSALYGYKFCLRLYLRGDGVGLGTHLSLYLKLSK